MILPEPHMLSDGEPDHRLMMITFTISAILHLCMLAGLIYFHHPGRVEISEEFYVSLYDLPQPATSPEPLSPDEPIPEVSPEEEVLPEEVVPEPETAEVTEVEPEPATPEPVESELEPIPTEPEDTYVDPEMAEPEKPESPKTVEKPESNPEPENPPPSKPLHIKPLFTKPKKTREDLIKKAIARVRDKVQRSGPVYESGSPGGGIGTRTTDIIKLYQMDVAREIEKNWAFSEEFAGEYGKHLKAMVICRVLPNGKISHVWFEKASGNKYLDESVRRAIAKSDPVLPHPKGINRPYVDVGMIFTPEGMK